METEESWIKIEEAGKGLIRPERRMRLEEDEERQKRPEKNYLGQKDV